MRSNCVVAARLVVVHAEGADALQLGKLQHIQDDAAGARNLERVMGIEPTLVAWEATVLPLNYTRFVVRILCSGPPDRQASVP